MPISILYYFLAGLVATASLCILITHDILYAALCLIITLVSLAGIYFLQGAAFLAVIYIIIYGGGVLLIVLFSLMLLKPNNSLASKQIKLATTLAIVAALILSLGPFLWFTTVSLLQPTLPQTYVESTVATLGLELLGNYALALELVGIILLIALVGALYIARGKHTDPASPESWDKTVTNST